MVIFVIYISAFSSFISSAEGKRRSSTQAKRKQHTLKGQKLIEAARPLPLLYPSASDFQFRYAPVTVGSGRVGLTCETCIYKISYQILFGFTVEYVLVRKKFFYEKSIKVSSFGRT